MASQLKVITLNMRNGRAADGRDSWGFRSRDLISFIGQKDPDIVGFQEVMKDQLSQIAEGLGAHIFVAAGRDDGIDGGEHCPIFYRRDHFRLVSSGTRWVSPTPDVPGSLGGSANHTRIFTWAELTHIAGEKLLVVNCHLDHQAADARLLGAEQMAEFVGGHSGAAIVVMGDFNSVSSDAPLSHLVTVGKLTDLVPEGPTGTFNEWNTGHLEGEMIDHILVSEGVVANEVRIDRSMRWDEVDQVNRTLSDHFAVIATIEI